MNAQTKPITSWRELSNMLVEAMEWSNPTTAEPVGVAQFERLGNDMVRMVITVDLVPRNKVAIIQEEDIPF